MRRLDLRFCLPLLLANAGCVGHFHHGGALAFGLLAGAAIASSERPDVERVVVYEPAPVLVAPPLPPSDPPIPPIEGRGPFDAAAARLALRSADLTSCREHGVPRGYVHARVTFAPSGAASKVVVDAPDSLGNEAVECIGARAGAARTAPFDGAEASVSISWFVT